MAMKHEVLIEKYLAGPEVLRRSVAGMSNMQLDARPVPFKWSARQVVLHIADFDLVYADHMKRVIAESEPMLLDGNRDSFAAHLAYNQRDVDEEIRMIEAVRRHMGRILTSLDVNAFERKAIYSARGPVTLADLLQDAADHIPHHGQYIEEKRKALRVGERATPFHHACVS
jgi:hypothetical protein